MSTALTYIESGRSFSPSKFKSSFKDGIARPSLYHFNLIRYPNIFFLDTYPNIFFLDTGTNPTISNVLGLNNFLSPSSTTAINKNYGRLLTSSTYIMNKGESIYQDLNGRGLSELVFRANKIILPEKVIQTYQTKIYGPSTEFPREIENGKFAVSFLTSGTFYEHDLFSTWVDRTFDYDRKSESPSYNVAYYDDIVSDAQIISYSENGNATYLQTFEDIYPVSVGSITYDWNEKNEIIEFTVVFSYKILKTQKILKSVSVSNSGLLEITDTIFKNNL